FRWLANGPRALAGFERPLVNLFPLPGESLASILLFGVIIWFFWFGGTTVLTHLLNDGSGEGLWSTVVRSLFAITLLGVGYWFARRAQDSTRSARRQGAMAGIVVGAVTVVAMVATPAALNQSIGFLVVGAFSLFTWVLVGRLYTWFYAELSRRDHLVGAGLTLTVLATLVPLVFLGSSRAESQSVLGLLITAGLVAVFIYGLFRLSGVWREYSEVSILRIVGVGTVWLVLLRYWVLPLIGPVTNGNVGQALGDTIRNLIWLLRFDANLGIIIRYDRFLFISIVAAVIGVYILAEETVQSPFGRVLKAIREDEDVATALGKNTFSYKVQSMALGSAIAGLAGGFTAIQFQALSWSIFRVEVTFIVLLMVIIGGTANHRGAILGSAIYWAFSRGTTDLAAFFPTAASSSIAALRRVIIGILLIIILYYRPQGLWGEE
ncbi:MAG: branched-chain amino acid ABC transporter permease, partial [Halobacteriales archaeon]|nr:branched-chain amino acid ABC transporter permease [Halobacteriales archaeon]